MVRRGQYIQFPDGWTLQVIKETKKGILAVIPHTNAVTLLTRKDFKVIPQDEYNQQNTNGTQPTTMGGRTLANARERRRGKAEKA